MSCTESPKRASNKRPASPASVTNKFSAKRRRISLASTDFSRELDFAHDGQDRSRTGVISAADRFISARPKLALPLDITPRTRRIAKSFDLVDDRVLSYDHSEPSTSSHKTQLNSLLRDSASQLYSQSPVLRPTSVTSNLAVHKQSIMALDTPGIPIDTFANPISWSEDNYIAVTCNDGVYYQNLETKIVQRLRTDRSLQVLSLKWAGKSRSHLLAIGTSEGTVQIWHTPTDDEPISHMIDDWEDGDGRVTSMDWNESVLTVGRARGVINLYDIRASYESRQIQGHKSTVTSTSWSPDGKYLACGDKSGIVRIWDARASKNLWDDEIGKRSSKMRHRGPVKALAWCPWDAHLLATGSAYPEGTIRVFSASALSSPPAPISSVTLDTSVLSLHWSPHCRELLSTQGSSFEPPKLLQNTRGGMEPDSHTLREAWRSKMVVRKSALTNSIVVHAYPSWKRLLTIPGAHPGVIAHSCLSPDGTKVFTACAYQEALKMWKVWDIRAEVEKRESIFDKCMIR